jgi:hypothetical protein
MTGDTGEWGINVEKLNHDIGFRLGDVDRRRAEP